MFMIILKTFAEKNREQHDVCIIFSFSFILEMVYRRRKASKNETLIQPTFSPLLSMTLDCSISFSYRAKIYSNQSEKKKLTKVLIPCA